MISTGSRAPGTLLAETFTRLRRARRPALMPFLTAGYPNPEVFRALLHAAGPAGADVIEVGIPFSDPLADGPAIQHSSQVALTHGVTLGGVLEELAAASSLPPVVIMTYVNPILGLGWDAFADGAARAGVAGVIVPDLPLEEGKELEERLATRKIDLVYLAAPTTGEARLRQLGRRSRGFLYLVSVTGVTGARAALPDHVANFVARARHATELPLCLGFGIAGAAHAAEAARHADGVIVGSAIVNRIRDLADGGYAGIGTDAVVNAVTGFLGELRRGLDAEAGRETS